MSDFEIASAWVDYMNGVTDVDPLKDVKPSRVAVSVAHDVYGDWVTYSDGSREYNSIGD